MRAPISVVIPTLNAQETLGACLTALMPGVEAGLIREAIISDGGSVDETCEIAQNWGAELVTGAASRGGQLKRGVATARGEWVLVLHADTVLSPDWTAAAVTHMSAQPDKAGWFSLCFDRGGRAVAAWANLRSRMGLPYGDQGLLISTALYEEVSGYADQPLMEDVALARALRGRLVRLPAVAVTSAAAYRKQGWLRRGARNIWLLLQYSLGADPHVLARAYRR